MHKLLSDQLKYVFGHDDTVPQPWQHFINIIGQSYSRYDEIIRRERLTHERKVKEKDDALGKEHARLGASIKILNVGFVLTDLEGKILVINSAAKFILFARRLTPVV